MLNTPRYKVGEGPASSYTRPGPAYNPIEGYESGLSLAQPAQPPRDDVSPHQDMQVPHRKWRVKAQWDEAQSASHSLSSSLDGFAQEASSLLGQNVPPQSDDAAHGSDENQASRQRLVQAMASFRGASGIPVMTRHDQTGIAHESWQISGKNQQKHVIGI